MSTKAETWMPIYIGDYLGDTQRLTTEQHGAYLLLIFDYWRNGALPDDDAVLQQVTRLDRAAWKRHRPTLAKMFTIRDGQWFHKRIERERVSALDNQDRRTAKARAAADARWSSNGNAPSIPDAALGGCPPPSPSKNKSLDKNNTARKPVAVGDQVWGDFLKLRKAKRAPLTATALEGIRKEVEAAGWSMEAALTECVVRGWQGFKAEWVKGRTDNGGNLRSGGGNGADKRSGLARAIDRELGGTSPALPQVPALLGGDAAKEGRG